MTDATPKCPKCGTPMETLGWDYACPLPASACQSIAALRSEVEALRKRNEELELDVEFANHSAELLSSQMIYKGNSVHHWWCKAVAYKKVVGDMCDLVAKHGFEFDGETSVLILMERALGRLSVSELRAQELEQQVEAWRHKASGWLVEKMALETTLQELETKLRAAEDAVVPLRDVLQNARLNIKDWAAYAGDYFREKHRLKDDLAECDNALSNTSALAAQRKREIVREALDASLPARRSGESYDLRSDGYQRGWNDCLDVINRMILNPTEPA